MNLAVTCLFHDLVELNKTPVGILVMYLSLMILIVLMPHAAAN